MTSICNHLSRGLPKKMTIFFTAARERPRARSLITGTDFRTITGTLGPTTGRQGPGRARYAFRSVSQPVGLGGRKRAVTDFDLACDPKKKYRAGPLQRMNRYGHLLSLIRIGPGHVESEPRFRTFSRTETVSHEPCSGAKVLVCSLVLQMLMYQVFYRGLDDPAGHTLR